MIAMGALLLSAKVKWVSAGEDKMKNSRFAVSSQAGLQKVGKLGVPVWNVALLEHKQNQFIYRENEQNLEFQHAVVHRLRSCSLPELSTVVFCFCLQTLLASAVMTMPRLDREPLMAVISLKRSPWDWLFSIRSLPAKSTRHRVALCTKTDKNIFIKMVER